MSRAAVSPETAAAPVQRETRSRRKTPPRPRVGGGSGAREVPVSKTTPKRKKSYALRLAEAAAEGGIEGQEREQEKINDERILEVVQLSSSPLTTSEIAGRVGLAEWGAGASLARLQADKKVTEIGGKWYPGKPEDDRTLRRSRPTFGPRRTPRELVEDAIRDRRLTWSQLRDALPELEPHRIRHGLDLIGADGFLSFNSKGYALRKKRGKPTTPIGVARPDLQQQLGILLEA